MDTAIPLGKEGKIQFQVMDNEVKISIGYSGAEASAGAYIMASPDQIIKALGDIIPGDSSAEKFLLSGLKMAFEAAMTTSQSVAANDVQAPQTLPAGTVQIK